MNPKREWHLLEQQLQLGQTYMILVHGIESLQVGLRLPCLGPEQVGGRFHTLLITVGSDTQIFGSLLHGSFGKLKLFSGLRN